MILHPISLFVTKTTSKHCKEQKICVIVLMNKRNTNTMTQIYSYEKIRNDMRLLELLSQSVPNIGAACTEIINLEAILNLPKGTEHFLADLHGEYEAFQHVLRNASGAIKRKVNEIFGNNLREMEKKELCTLIYYPEQKLQLVKEVEKDLVDWYVITLNQLVKVCQNVSSKYTRSKVRKALPEEFSYIIQELLHESPMDPNKQATSMSLSVPLLRHAVPTTSSLHCVT